jgi:hypothetical protein
MTAFDVIMIVSGVFGLLAIFLNGLLGYGLYRAWLAERKETSDEAMEGWSSAQWQSHPSP